MIETQKTAYFEYVKETMGNEWDLYSDWDVEKEPYCLKFNLIDNSFSSDQLDDIAMYLKGFIHNDQRVESDFLNLLLDTDKYDCEIIVDSDSIHYHYHKKD